mmetsp:Transcript_32219/g.75069  ORF Transcript_32219/g.75069 Transcript_32219/m.75069 type:complete len:229 (-) Transcript_32219:299-985(-)
MSKASVKSSDAKSGKRAKSGNWKYPVKTNASPSRKGVARNARHSPPEPIAAGGSSSSTSPCSCARMTNAPSLRTAGALSAGGGNSASTEKATESSSAVDCAASKARRMSASDCTSAWCSCQERLCNCSCWCSKACAAPKSCISQRTECSPSLSARASFAGSDLGGSGCACLCCTIRRAMSGSKCDGSRSSPTAASGMGGAVASLDCGRMHAAITSGVTEAGRRSRKRE